MNKINLLSIIIEPCDFELIVEQSHGPMTDWFWVLEVKADAGLDSEIKRK
jgi:hypothetical protein